MTLIPILSYGLVFDDRPIVTASRELAESYTDPDLTMAEHLAEAFVSEGRWCRVGADIHTLGHGDFELLAGDLRPRACSCRVLVGVQAVGPAG
ncbi:hypothetical protein OG196_24355 [Kitasatospora purpeofusca]|uniref:hypothetical protein n=1 Tax=Kitasatospora purpeofusca TaxID=67352 RepID=UPI002E15E5E6|nr:hypothetical protein OG196_24355 [Kitasatospora purpeofusca]